MEIEPKTLKNLTIASFVLSVIAILFIIILLFIAYCRNSIVDLQEFRHLHPDLKNLYRDIALGPNGFRHYTDQINDRYEKEVDAAGGEDDYNNNARRLLKDKVKSNSLISYLKGLLDSFQFN
jgi:hypothetical protein